MKKVALFYDANCFTTIPIQDLKFAMKNADNFILSPVKEEIAKGKRNNPDRLEFNLVLSSKDQLTNNFTEVSLDYCQKSRNADMRKRPLFLKENPISCSAYYTWLASALNPAVVTDIYRHVFNELVNELKNPPQDLETLLNIESMLRVKETQAIEKINTRVGKNPIVKPSWILKSRRKRIEEIKNNQLTLSDYQTVTAALIYFCASGRCTVIITSDRDFLDIWNNLFRTIIERFATIELLKEKIQNLKDEELINYNRDGLEIILNIDDISNKGIFILEEIKTEKDQMPFVIWLYRSDQNKIFIYEEVIPLWLRKFILEYKKNLDCYSIESNIEMKYNFIYYFDPNFNSNTVKYHISPRKSKSTNLCATDCEKYCRYVQEEKNDPSKLSDFI